METKSLVVFNFWCGIDRKKESLDLIWSSIEAELKEEIKRAFNSEEVSQKDEEKADEETADEEKMDEQEPASQIPEDETVDRYE